MSWRVRHARAAKSAVCPAEGPAQPVAGGVGGSRWSLLEQAGDARRLTGGGPRGQLSVSLSLSSVSPALGSGALTCSSGGSCLLHLWPCGSYGRWPSLSPWYWPRG